MAKILFIQKEQFLARENIGIMTLSAVLKANGHDTDLLIIGTNGYPILNKSYSDSPLSQLKNYYKVEFRRASKKQSIATKNVVDYVKYYNPDIIGFSVMTIDSEWVLEIASLLKDHGINKLIIAGGSHPTFFSDYIENDCIDAINIGEGEYSLLDLANAIDNEDDITSIKNLCIKKDGKIYANKPRLLVDINKLPVPDRSIYMKYECFKKQKTYNFIITRGCPYNCTFCYVHQWKKVYQDDPYRNKIRLRNVEAVINEIKDFSQKVKIQRLYFSDSTFNIDTKWTLDFLDRYGKEIAIPYTINVRSNLLTDVVVKAIADTKCCENVRMGFETGSERVRKQILGKPISNKQIFETIDLLNKYEIKYVAFTMYGIPTETFKEAMETVEMLHKIRPYAFSSQIFHPYEGLDITESAIKSGLIIKDDILKLGKNEYKRFKSILRQPAIDEVINLMKLSIIAIKFPLLWPLIKNIAKLNMNPLFTALYIISSYAMDRKYRI